MSEDPTFSSTKEPGRDAVRFTAGEENADVLLDAPRLSADDLNLEIEDLEIDGVLRIGKVSLNAENLDAQLYLKADLDNLRVIVERMTGTANLAMSLFFMPAYNFNLWSGLAYRNLETMRRIMETQSAGSPANGRRNGHPKRRVPLK